MSNFFRCIQNNLVYHTGPVSPPGGDGSTFSRLQYSISEQPHSWIHFSLHLLRVPGAVRVHARHPPQPEAEEGLGPEGRDLLQNHFPNPLPTLQLQLLALPSGQPPVLFLNSTRLGSGLCSKDIVVST